MIPVSLSCSKKEKPKMKTIMMMLAVALLCGCATTEQRAAKKVAQAKMALAPRPPAIDKKTKKAVRVIVSSKQKTARSAAAMESVTFPNGIIMTRVPFPGEPTSFGFQFDYPHGPGTNGLIWFCINNWYLDTNGVWRADPLLTWFKAFNVTDSSTNAYAYAPCVTRGGQPPNGKYVSVLSAMFFGHVNSPARFAPSGSDAFEKKFQAKKKELGKDAVNWGMRLDGSLVHLK
jgi:hypothetical protein